MSGPAAQPLLQWLACQPPQLMPAALLEQAWLRPPWLMGTCPTCPPTPMAGPAQCWDCWVWRSLTCRGVPQSWLQNAGLLQGACPRRR